MSTKSSWPVVASPTNYMVLVVVPASLIDPRLSLRPKISRIGRGPLIDKQGIMDSGGLWIPERQAMCKWRYPTP